MNEHPVDELDQAEFDYWTGIVANQLSQRGAAVIDFEPGDATRYVLAFVFPAKMGGDGHWHTDKRPLWMGTSFGELYQVSVGSRYDWGYVLDHWLRYCPHSYAEHTARVLARFLNTLADRMRAAD